MGESTDRPTIEIELSPRGVGAVTVRVCRDGRDAGYAFLEALLPTIRELSRQARHAGDAAALTAEQQSADPIRA